MSSSYQSSLNKRFQNNRFSSSSHSERQSVHTTTKLKSAFLTSELYWESFFTDWFWILVAIPASGSCLEAAQESHWPGHWQWKHPWRTSSPSRAGPEWGPSVWVRSMAARDLQHRRWERRWNGSGKVGGPPKCSVRSAVLHVVTGHCSQQLNSSPLPQGCLWLKPFCTKGSQGHMRTGRQLELQSQPFPGLEPQVNWGCFVSAIYSFEWWAPTPGLAWSSCYFPAYCTLALLLGDAGTATYSSI